MRGRIVLSAVLAAALFATRGDACQGARTPVCTRGLWVSILTEKSVVLSDGDVVVTVRVLPYVTWNPNPACNQPLSSTLDLRLTCAAPSGPPIVIDPPVIDLGVPAAPGLQDELSVNVVVPAGRLDPTVPVECDVTGDFAVRFGGGAPTGGTLTANGATKVCLVPPTILDPRLPRLQICCIAPDDKLHRTILRGDQAPTYYLICNNDPFESVTLDLTSEGEQLGRLPAGFDPTDPDTAFTADVTSFSNPDTGTDTFSASFLEDVIPGALLPLIDPTIVDPFALQRQSIVIPPLGCEIVCILQRSHGMCQSGSCTQRFVRVVGTFSGGDPALGCASSAIVVVDGAPPHVPLCRWEVRNKVSPKVQAQFSPDSFFDEGVEIAHATSHSRGNVAPGGAIIGDRNGRVLELAGIDIPVLGGVPFPEDAVDTLGLDVDPTSTESHVVAFPDTQSQPGQLPPVLSQSLNIIDIQNLDKFQGSLLQLPLVGGVDPFEFVNLQVSFDAELGMLFVDDVGNPTNPPFIGTIQQFLENPPPGRAIDPGTCKEFRKIQTPGEGFIVAIPHRQTFFIGKKDLIEWRRTPIDVFSGPGAPLDPAAWTASTDTVVARLENGKTTGTPGEPIPIEMVELSLQSANPLDVNVGWVDVTSPDGVNMVQIPYAARFSDKTGKPKANQGGAGGTKKSFKKVPPGATAMGTLRIQNKGKGPFTFDLMQLPGNIPFSLEDPSHVGRHTLAPKTQMEVGIIYAPTGVEGKKKGKDKFKWEMPRCDKTKPLKVGLAGSWKIPKEPKGEK